MLCSKIMLPYKHFFSALLIFAGVATASATRNGVDARHGVDKTLQRDAVGWTVVEATVAKIRSSCIFADDKLFLRRLAYLSTKDGYDRDVAASGGIWAVSRSQFWQTKQRTQNLINQKFGINWTRIQYNDLQMPLYSALAAMITIFMYRQEVPRDTAAQADLWISKFNSRGTRNMFENTATQLDQGCYYKSKMDLVFLLDGSGSVGKSDFFKMADFTQRFIDGFEVGTNASEFGLMVFATYVNEQVSLGENKNKQELLRAAKNLKYPSGGTDTAEGIADARKMFRHHGRHGVPKIAIVLTDGQSNSHSNTKEEARKLKEDQVTVFAIGIGSGTNQEEMVNIASSPSCTHVFDLSDFAELTALRSEISKETCEAPTFLPERSTVAVRLQPGVQQKCNFRMPGREATVNMTVNHGRVTYLLSNEDYPNLANYQKKVEAGAGQVRFPHVSREYGRSDEMYCTIIGDPSVSAEVEITILRGKQDVCSNNPCRGRNFKCIPHGHGHQCVCARGYTGRRCDIPARVVIPGQNSTIPAAQCLKVPLGNGWATIKTTCAGKVYTSKETCPTDQQYDTKTHIQAGAKKSIYLRPAEQEQSISGQPSPEDSDDVFLMTDYTDECRNDTVSHGAPPQIIFPDVTNQHHLVDRKFLVQIPTVGATIKFITDLGMAHIFAQFDDYPTKDSHTWNSSTLPGQWGAIYIPRQPSNEMDTEAYVYCLVQAPKDARIDITVQSGDAIPCRSQPCKNGARCINKAGNPFCICRPGLIGAHCETNTVRIEGDRLHGVLEIFEEGLWKHVCHSSYWTNDVAKVACRQLGLPDGIATRGRQKNRRNYHYGFSCQGNEEGIDQCSVLNSGYCDAFAYLSCNATTEVRLASGTNTGGRVEVRHNGRWGTICDDSWNDVNARLVCKMLGLQGGVAVGLSQTVFGPGKGQILLDDVTCNGDEIDIGQCRHDGWGRSNCQHYEDAAVLCADENPCTINPCLNKGACLVDGVGFQCSCTKGFVDSICSTNETMKHMLDLRLVGGSDVAGRVLLTTGRGNENGQGKNLTICNERKPSQNHTDAEKILAPLVCKLLGKEGGHPEIYESGKEGEEDLVVSRISCSGSETNLGLCDLDVNKTCPINQRFGVTCGTGNALYLPEPEGEHIPPQANHIPIYKSFKYKEDDVLKENEANENNEDNRDENNGEDQPVVRGVKAVSSHSSGPTIFKKRKSSICDNTICENGGKCIDEGDTWRCDCRNGTSGLICEINSARMNHSKVRLVGGDSLTGRVELLVNGTWGRMCAVDDQNFAEVVCRELGLDLGMRSVVKADTIGEGNVTASSAKCMGHEYSLVDCDVDYTDGAATCESDAAVSCNIYCSDAANDECPSDNFPVCGSDKVTWHPNECVYRKKLCARDSVDNFLYVAKEHPCAGQMQIGERSTAPRLFIVSQILAHVVMILLTFTFTSSFV